MTARLRREGEGTFEIGIEPTNQYLSVRPYTKDLSLDLNKARAPKGTGRTWPKTK